MFVLSVLVDRCFIACCYGNFFSARAILALEPGCDPVHVQVVYVLDLVPTTFCCFSVEGKL